jgi:prepilin-type N-terminal cleavage/methylation domain-containing protein
VTNRSVSPHPRLSYAKWSWAALRLRSTRDNVSVAALVGLTPSGARTMHRGRRGFTLIELLIVVVIIGILAAIAIPKFQSTKGKAYLASMKSDLRNVSIAEEGYFYDHRSYTTILDSLAFAPSPGVTLTLVQGDTTGWSATTANPNAYPHVCAVFYGSVAPVAPAENEGQVACQ